MSLFDTYIQSVFLEMARGDLPIKTSSIEEWPYTNYDMEGKSGAFINKHGRYPTEAIQQMIKVAAEQLAQNSDIHEISVGDLKNKLKAAFEAGTDFNGSSLKLKSGHAEKHAGRAIEQLVAFLKSKGGDVKQKVAQTVAKVTKTIEQQPAQADVEIEKGADEVSQLISKETPAAQVKQETTPEPESALEGGSTKEVTDILDQEFSMVEELYDKVVEDVDALNKRAGKKGIPLISVEKTGEEVVEKRYDPSKINSRRGIMLKKIKFRIKVPQLQLPGGWKFIGRVDHTAIGNLIVSVPDSGHEEDLHKLYGNSQPSYCDHCHTTRRRTSTFVVQDAQGGLKRIGRQCLKDYLPGGEQGVKKMLDYADYLSKIAEGLREFETRGGSEDDGGERMGGGSSRYDNFGIKPTLGIALAYIRKLGYLSKSKASADNETGGYSEPTSAKIVRGITGELEDRLAKDKNNGSLLAELSALNDYRENKEKYEAEADKVIEWGKDYITKQLERPSNMTEYFKNLQTILNGAATSGAIPEKYLGYLVSIIPAYNKAIDAQDQEKLSKERGEQVSNYVGTIGAPIGELNYNDKRKLKKMGAEGLDKFPYNGPIPVTVTGSRGFERQGFGYYDTGGTTTMINMIDNDGNVYVYFANGDQDVEKGHKFVIKRALVKNHKEYSNKNTGKVTKQTVLTRATLDDAPANESFTFASYYSTNN